MPVCLGSGLAVNIDDHRDCRAGVAVVDDDDDNDDADNGDDDNNNTTTNENEVVEVPPAVWQQRRSRQDSAIDAIRGNPSLEMSG